MKADTRTIITLERNMNELFASNKKVTAIPESPDALIQIYDRPYILSRNKFNEGCRLILYRNIKIRNSFKVRVLPSLYQQLFEVNTGTRDFTCTLKGAKTI